jgi:UDP-2,3-diacylglucosamine hydrolase
LNRDKIYFASDFHLGLDHIFPSKEREIKIVQWLDTIKSDCAELYLVGDVFDYWFEYKTVVPKGCMRLLGKLCEMSDQGIKIHLFTGNHDMWIFDYFTKEIGLEMHYQPINVSYHGKAFHIAHGDGLGPADYGYKFIKKIFTNPICQWLFHRLHPNFGLWLMKKTSHTSRMTDDEDVKITDPEKEWLVQYSNDYVKGHAVDYFVYGHRHHPMTYQLKNSEAKVIYLGDWLTHFTYLRVSEGGVELCGY